jgi:hypothetical protein
MADGTGGEKAGAARVSEEQIAAALDTLESAFGDAVALAASDVLAQVSEGGGGADLRRAFDAAVERRVGAFARGVYWRALGLHVKGEDDGSLHDVLSQAAESVREELEGRGVEVPDAEDEG